MLQKNDTDKVFYQLHFLLFYLLNNLLYRVKTFISLIVHACRLTMIIEVIFQSLLYSYTAAYFLLCLFFLLQFNSMELFNFIL